MLSVLLSRLLHLKVVLGTNPSGAGFVDKIEEGDTKAEVLILKLNLNSRRN